MAEYMWVRSANPEGKSYSLLHLQAGQSAELEAVRVCSSTISASLVAQERDEQVAGQWYSGDSYFFNLSLTGRPLSARGRFEGMEGGYHPVGELFFIPAGQRYLAQGGPGSQRTLFVELAVDQQLRDELKIGTDAAPVWRTCMNMPFDRVRDILHRMAREVREPGFASELMVEGLGVTLLAETLRILRQMEANAARKGGLSPWRLRTIEARIQDGATLPTLGELAELCGLSRRQLMRAFREETGRTVGAFVQDLTLDRAKALLQHTDLPIGEVAAQVGFTTATAFSTAFRRSIGESPRSFRATRSKT
ncbi:helix-turn-helix transcriptional regulator [Sphingobium sp. AP49]|uniref:AraC family transcriptional regulator n=1 Tax=Sphingobium sp. AP49 TaxID=1144307 RepID=UPI00026ED6D6|nr:AraC family transcriptional regulator [Sphingobium sp. AP49]WHO37239.1 helix-turn-helix transcriptional regulator [Sphingobium sp. AP49]